MSINTEKVLHLTENDVTSRHESSHRIHAKTGVKAKTLRLDSPTTIEACKELGIRINDLKPKVIEDFKDPTLEEEVIQLRFNHYLQRYNQMVIDVFARKRELTRARQRAPSLNKNPGEENHHGGKSMTAGGHSRYARNSSPSGMKHSHSHSNILVPPPMMLNYNKTVAYLRTSHDTNQVKDIGEILGGDNSFGSMDEVTDRFDTALAMEVSKFNKIKRQKQKEALDAFQEEMKRVKMMENLKEREKRRKEKEKKNALEKKKLEEERKSRAEDKLEQIREAERKYVEAKEKEKEKMKKRLEETKKKLAEEDEERKRQIAEHEEKLEERRKRAEMMRIKLKEDEQARCDQLRMDIQMKLNQSTEKHNFNIYEKTSRVKYQINKIEDNVKKIKIKQGQQNEDFVKKLVEKLVKKEESSKVYQKKQLLLTKQREEEMKEKNTRFIELKSDLNKQYKDRMKEINDRFQKVQENLEAKKIQDEKNMKLKKEMSRLKLLDIQDNYTRKQRQISYERQKVLDRAKTNELKIVELKQQRDILQQAKLEATIQSKIEKDRIEEAIQLLGKVTINGKASTEKLTDAQKKILREILTPEDYALLEEEERRKEQEKLAVLEALKNGNIVQPVKAR